MWTTILGEVNFKGLSLKGTMHHYQSEQGKRTTAFTFLRRSINDYKNIIGHLTHKMLSWCK
jgi:hypothetical protein